MEINKSEANILLQALKVMPVQTTVEGLSNGFTLKPEVAQLISKLTENTMEVETTPLSEEPTEKTNTTNVEESKDLHTPESEE